MSLFRCKTADQEFIKLVAFHVEGLTSPKSVFCSTFIVTKNQMKECCSKN